MICFQAGGAAAAAEDREVMLAAIAGPNEDDPSVCVTEPPDRVLGVTAVDDAADEPDQRRQYDEVALSTLPKGVSRWLGLDIPHQVQRRFHVPVTVISVSRSHTSE